MHITESQTRSTCGGLAIDKGLAVLELHHAPLKCAGGRCGNVKNVNGSRITSQSQKASPHFCMASFQVALF